MSRIKPNFLGALAHGNSVIDQKAQENNEWEGWLVSRISLFLSSSLVAAIDALAHLLLGLSCLTRRAVNIIQRTDPLPLFKGGKHLWQAGKSIALFFAAPWIGVYSPGVLSKLVNAKEISKNQDILPTEIPFKNTEPNYELVIRKGYDAKITTQIQNYIKSQKAQVDKDTKPFCLYLIPTQSVNMKGMIDETELNAKVKEHNNRVVIIAFKITGDETQGQKIANPWNQPLVTLFYYSAKNKIEIEANKDFFPELNAAIKKLG